MGRVQFGFIWVNDAGLHFLNAGSADYKQSGISHEESIEELLSFTRSKNINITL